MKPINEILLALFLSLGVICFLIYIFQPYNQDTSNETECNCITEDKYIALAERYTMCDKTIKFAFENNRTLNGGYFQGADYYCVWTKNRTEESIVGTEQHELCHAMVYEDKEHFCEGKLT